MERISPLRTIVAICAIVASETGEAGRRMSELYKNAPSARISNK
jgi:hypothetical protein